MNRRDLLKRLPAVPFVAGAAATQAPGMMQRFGTFFQRGMNVPIPMSPVTFAERTKWFTDGLQWIAKPSLPQPGAIDFVDVNVMRAIVQWERFWEQITISAQNNGIPIEDAKQIALDWLAKNG